MVRPLAFMLILGLAAACSDGGSGPVDVIPVELAGTWIATPACRPDCGFTFESVTNAADSVNFTAFGATTTFTLTTSGDFTFDPGLPTVGDAEGEMRLEPGVLVVQPTSEFPEEERIDYQLVGGRLRLSWRETVTYTLPDAEGPSTVRVRAVLERP